MFIKIFLKVPDTEDETAGATDEFKEFSKLLYNGQKVADETGKTYTFMWQGYRACVSSQLAKLTSFEVKRRFDLAMKFIKSGQSNEDCFKIPKATSSGQSSSISSNKAASGPIESEEPTQIPDTQFHMEGIYENLRVFILNKKYSIEI